MVVSPANSIGEMFINDAKDVGSLGDHDEDEEEVDEQ